MNGLPTFPSDLVKFVLFVSLTWTCFAHSSWAQPGPAGEPAPDVLETAPGAAATPSAPNPATPIEEPVSLPIAVPSAPEVEPPPATTVSAVAAEPPKVEPEAPIVTVAAGRGLTVTSKDGKNSLTVRSRVQLRETFTHERRDGGPGRYENTNEIQVRTLRFYVQGNVLDKDLKYVIQLAFGAGDFERDNPSPIFDAYIEYVKIRDLNIRFGQYFVPFDRARTIREFALEMVDRPTVVRELTLDRDVGLMLSSQDLFGLDQHLGYHVFVGGGDGRNRVADLKNRYGPQHPSVLVIGRIVLKPFGAFEDYDQEGDLSRGAKPRLGIGVGGGYNLQTDRTNSTYGATYTAGTFNYTHLAADLSFKWQGFSLLTEYVQRTANKDSVTSEVGGELLTQYSRSGKGYFVQAAQMLTKRLQVMARWDDLYANAGTDPAMAGLAKESGRQVGTGMTVYLNGHFFKIQADYFLILNRLTDEPRHAARAQLDAMF